MVCVLQVFFTIRLISQQSAMSLGEIADPDPLMNSELMDGRDTFLTRARDEHWEFSSLRRAKFSTLALCYSLHETDGSKGIDYTCNKCGNGNAKWHCTVCEVSGRVTVVGEEEQIFVNWITVLMESLQDYDLCQECKGVTDHEHPLEAIKTLVDDMRSENNGSSRYESIQVRKFS